MIKSDKKLMVRVRVLPCEFLDTILLINEKVNSPGCDFQLLPIRQNTEQAPAEE
jgi:hypothetical protein